MTDLLTAFVLNLSATVVGIFVVLLMERQRRPHLAMKVGVPGRLADSDPAKRPATTWLHVQIHNVRMPKWVSWIYDRDPAFSCKATVTFHYLDGHRVFDREMNARWNETPQPKFEELKTDVGVVSFPVEIRDTIDIPPGDYANVAVATRRKGEFDCFGWNNESYLYGWQHPQWKLEKGRYIVRLKAKTGGREFVDAFLIENDVPYEDFRIEILDKKIKKLLR